MIINLLKFYKTYQTTIDYKDRTNIYMQPEKFEKNISHQLTVVDFVESNKKQGRNPKIIIYISSALSQCRRAFLKNTNGIGKNQTRELVLRKKRDILETKKRM